MWPQLLKQPHRSFAAPALIYSQVHPGHIGGAGRDVNVMGHGGSQKAKQGGAGEAVNFEVFLDLGGTENVACCVRVLPAARCL